MTVYRTIPFMLVAVLCLSGCTASIGGDLRNAKSINYLATCGENQAEYQIIYKSDAKDSPGDNIAFYIDSLTFYIIPTYWTTIVHSEATILHNGTPILTRKYKSRIHEYYGILWLFIPTSKSINTLGVDDSVGIEIKQGIKYRTLYKIICDNGGTENQFYQYCLLKEDDP